MRRAWEEFIPVLDFPRRSAGSSNTTKAIESTNFQLRRVTKNRGQFPRTRPPTSCST